MAVLPILMAMLVTFAYSRDLNLMLNDEEAAQSLSVNVLRSRLILLTLVAVMTGAAVSVAGAMQVTNTTALADRQITTLSGGERRRVFWRGRWLRKQLFCFWINRPATWTFAPR